MTEMLEWIKAVLKTTPERWLNLAEMLPAELMTAAPAPGEWSASQCLQHLLDLEMQVFPFRMQAILKGQEFPGFDPDTMGSQVDPSQSLLTMAWKLNQLRRESLQLFRGLDEPDLDKIGQHAELGPVKLGALLHEWAAHDLLHTLQAERALIQPFIQGCGPWKIYFEDQIIKQKSQ
jgi:hypothetical protein